MGTRTGGLTVGYLRQERRGGSLTTSFRRSRTIQREPAFDQNKDYEHTARIQMCACGLWKTGRFYDTQQFKGYKLFFSSSFVFPPRADVPCTVLCPFFSPLGTYEVIFIVGS